MVFVVVFFFLPLLARGSQRTCRNLAFTCVSCWSDRLAQSRQWTVIVTLRISVYSMLSTSVIRALFEGRSVSLFGYVLCNYNYCNPGPCWRTYVYVLVSRVVTVEESPNCYMFLVYTCFPPFSMVVGCCLPSRVWRPKRYGLEDIVQLLYLFYRLYWQLCNALSLKER